MTCEHQVGIKLFMKGRDRSSNSPVMYAKGFPVTKSSTIPSTSSPLEHLPESRDYASKQAQNPLSPHPPPGISFISIRSGVEVIRTCGKGLGEGIALMVQPVDQSCV